jgi:hypothetical protein
LRLHFRTVQSSHERHPVRFQVRSRPPISYFSQKFISRLKTVASFEGTEKEWVRWYDVWGIWELRDKSDFSLEYKVEYDFGSVAHRIIGVNDSFAFAGGNQSLADRS